MRRSGARPQDVEHARAERPTRLWVDRAFSLRGVGTVVTGTLWSGSIGAGDELRLEPSGTCGARSQRPGARPRRPACGCGSARRREPARDRAPGGRARGGARRGGCISGLVPARRRARRARADPGRRAPPRAPRDGERAGARRADRGALGAAPPRLAGRRRTRRPRRSARRDHGRRGVVLDPAPPRHRDAERMDLVERGDIAATVDAPVLATSLRHVADGELTGLERAGPWVFSAELARGARARSSASASRRRIRSTPASPLRPSRGRPTSSRCSVSSAAARSSTFREPRPRSADVRRPRRRSSRSSPAPACARRRSMTPSSSASSRRRERSSRSATATRSAPRRTRSRRMSRSSECRASGEITLARFRDLVGTGRRDAQLLLERFDRDGLTRRVGDARVLRRGADQALNTPSA